MRASKNLCVKAIRAGLDEEWRSRKVSQLRAEAEALQAENPFDERAAAKFEEARSLEVRKCK